VGGKREEFKETYRCIAWGIRYLLISKPENGN
jgi:hypothetical protein